MSVILKEIEKRKQILSDYDSKVKKLNDLKTELAILEKEVSETNTFELKAEIDELTNYAIQLGHIVVPMESNSEETIENENVKDQLSENLYL